MSTTTILTNDQVLNVGDTLASTDGRYELTLQAAGQLTLLGPAATVVWQSPRDQNPGRSYFAVMQSDGNFCVYAGAPGQITNGPIWATMCTIPGGGRCFAVVGTDGVFAVYRGADLTTIEGLLWSLDSAGANLIQKWAPLIHLHPADKSHPDSIENFLAVASSTTRAAPRSPAPPRWRQCATTTRPTATSL